MSHPGQGYAWENGLGVERAVVSPASHVRLLPPVDSDRVIPCVIFLRRRRGPAVW